MNPVGQSMQEPAGNAWGKKPHITPEPSAYGAAFLVLVLALLVIRRLNKLSKM